jgi:16S rRNA (cytidine1402-2'-O)-methyltransferase
MVRSPHGTLYLVSTPIGDYRDITFRALRVLREADVVVVEERREGERLLSRCDIRAKSVELLNEHNEDEASSYVLEHLAMGRNVALISDGGTPVLSDPGLVLVRRAVGVGAPVVPVPGPSSIIPALTVSGFSTDRFVFCGFLSPKSDRRKSELRALRGERRTMILMDTPYRLLPLLKDVGDVLGADRRVAIAFNLTLPDERVFRGTVRELVEGVERDRLKGEFVIVVEGSEGRPRSGAGDNPTARGR